MQNLVENAPTIVVIAASGIFAAFILAGFWWLGKRMWPENQIGTSDEHTKWMLRWGKDLAPVKKNQRVTYQPTVYASQTVDAQIVASDERKLPQRAVAR